MESISKFVECLVPISQCNLKCSYCYVMQENRRNSKTPPFCCSPEEIGYAFHRERWGGTLLVNLCAFGETLASPIMPQIIYNILKQGHFINVTNNGTMNNQFDEIIKFPKDMLSRLCFAFSFHYVELKRTHNLQNFINNVKKVKAAGCSILIQLNLADEYIPYLEDIKKICVDNFGAYPQVALTRKEGNEFSIFTSHTDEEYMALGQSFHSPLFEFTCKNFRIKRKEFCYAGDWSYKLDLATGDLRSCYFSRPYYNIYKKPDEKIKALTVGSNCHKAYCVNSSHFMSLGVIPSVPCPSYIDLRERADAKWYTDEMKAFLSTRLYDTNKEYGACKKIYSNFRFANYFIICRIMQAAKKIVKKIESLR